MEFGKPVSILKNIIPRIVTEPREDVAQARLERVGVAENKLAKVLRRFREEEITKQSFEELDCAVDAMLNVRVEPLIGRRRLELRGKTILHLPPKRY